ncbi:MAG: tail fiber domain-containing protein [Acidobacteria bacterium]|nr:tail fiber domain-containing protein [Acidobacteriota bacterium]
MKKFFSTFLLILLAGTALFAQTSVFTYQGKLTDGANAATGTYDLQFKLYDAVSGGTQIGSTVTNTNVAVANGTFTVQLDFGAAAFPGADRWLEIGVKKPAEPGYTTLAPRQQIASVPYAIRAANVSATSGDNVVAAINNAATTTTISDSRLPPNLVRLQPSSTQNADSAVLSNPVMDITGRQDNGGGNYTAISRFRTNTDGGFFTSGTISTGVVPTSGAGARMMWYPGKYAFRAGKVDSFGATYWDEANIGLGSVAFGDNTRASGANSFAANFGTTASGTESVALGNIGTASGDRSFAFNGTATGVGAIALGSGAQSTNDDALAMGPSSIAGGLASITIGPSVANGSFAVAIGLQNRAYGNFSMTLGKNATSCGRWDCDAAFGYYSGVVTIGDGCAGFSSDAVTASANNQVNIRGCGGFRFFTNQGMTAGVQLAAGGGSWSSISDRNMKENFAAVDSRQILKKVLNLPISTWNYKSQDKSIRHIGTMAQDFYAAFGVGESDKMIATIDPDGVAFAAIQGLSEELKDRDKKIAEQQQQLNDLERQVKQQQTLLEGMKKLLCADKPDAEVCRQ